MTAHTNTAGRLLPAFSMPFSLDAPYLIKNWLRRGQTSMIYGPSNVGKSFFVIDLVYSITTGEEWNGYRVKQGKVLYIATEGHSGLGQRLEALKVLRGVPPNYSDDQWQVLPEKIDLYASEGLQEVRELLGDHSFDLIIIDTLAMALGSGSENDNTTINAFLRNLSVLRGLSDAHIMLIHHTGKDHERGARGHSSLQAAVDTEISLKSEDGLVCVSTTKQRDYQRADKLYFYLESAVLGIDTDGDEFTSCVVRYTSKGDRPKKLSKAKQSVLDGLEKALKQARDVHPGNAAIPPNTRVVDDYTWKEIVLSDTKLSPNAKDDSRRRSFARITKELIDDGLISTDDNGLFWLTEETE